MAQLSCECLNIVLHTKGNHHPVNVSSLQLPLHAASIPFFKGKVCEVQLDLGGISKEQECLVQERKISDWVTYKCSNCETWCYASHAVKGLSRVLANGNLLDSAKQDALRASDDYSPLFKIILQEKVFKLKEHSLVTPMTGNEDAVRNSAAQLQDLLTKYLTKEKMAVDERIKKFADEQRAMFASLQRRAYRDKNIMIGRILDAEEHNLEESLTEAMLDSSGDIDVETPAKNSSYIARDTDAKSNTSNQVVPSIPTQPRPAGRKVGLVKVQTVEDRQRRADQRVPLKSSAVDNDDTLFDLEEDFDKDDQKPFFESDEDEESSTDDNSFKAESPLDRRARPQYAASVPISMPVWPKDRYPLETNLEDDDDKLPMPEPDRMVESMRALSMSVQDGTEMFGDLPRPRLNTGDFSRKKGF
ncbi:Proline-rich AKT1 substrate 1 [Holothuria leucospilota]|uniref:Proline-rich AKT1 substrate 1 n=1 Tax=Holothuria leucospilota TaxID=206669 RepID=A0A9Q0YM42_HOLLE|nr:Proline-rich AKT1 substrate 1 [Holothuria leucospilota]